METLTGSAGVAGGEQAARVRRLELLLGTIEVLEGDDDLAGRVARALGLLVDGGVCRAAGAVGLDGPAEAGDTGDAQVRAAGRGLAERAIAAGGEVGATVGGRELLAIPLWSQRRESGALWLADPSPAAADRALAHDVAARLARAADAERARRDQLARARELQRSDGLKSALLRGVTHELRTPLSGIKGAAEALAVIDDPAERADIIDAIVDETARLERVVSNLLDLSRVEGGVLAARMQWCVAEELVGAGLQASATFLAGVDVRTELPDDPPLVRADPVLTERILTNLLHNGVRHGAPPVTVSVRCGAGSVELAVTDAGGGVDPEVLPSVFEPFIHREGVGLGLGLPLCRRLAEAQDARLEHRRGPGGGASFVIVFPLHPAPPIAS
jgi:two-component system sensor histidine kinase KdpD